MDNTLEKIKDLILKSDLSLSEQDALIALFAEANDQDLEPMLRLFTEDPSWIHKINENYKSKRTAVSSGNTSLWQKIIEEEKAQLEEID